MVVGNILRQPIQQVGIPSRLFHVIDRLDQSAPKKSLPQAIDERAGQTRVLGLSEDLRKPLESRRFIGVRINGTEFGINEFEISLFSGGPIAADHFQWLISVNARQAVSIGEG